MKSVQRINNCQRLAYMVVCLFVSLSQISWADDFTIGKGDHYSAPRKSGLYRGEKITFKAYFNETAKYDLGDEDQLDTNKLYGSSDCGSFHQQNSARFGWRWNNERLEIMAFTHVGGQFFYEYIASAALNKSYQYEIMLSQDKGSYIFNFNGKTVTMPRGCKDSIMKGYKLYPYFGGNKVAPHEMLIKVEEGNDFANFSIENLYPNPTRDQTIYLDLAVMDDLSIGFQIYDLMGRLVQRIEFKDYSGSQDYSRIPINLNNFAAGLYLIQPIAEVEGEIKMGFVSSPGNAMKFIVL